MIILFPVVTIYCVANLSLRNKDILMLQNRSLIWDWITTQVTLEPPSSCCYVKLLTHDWDCCVYNVDLRVAFLALEITL